MFNFMKFLKKQTVQNYTIYLSRWYKFLADSDTEINSVINQNNLNDDNGEVFHRYGLVMVECECFNLIAEHDLVVNTYPAESPDWYAYAKISSGKVEKIIGCPTSARFIANQGNLILSVHSASGSTHQDFILVDIDKPDHKLASFEFFSANGEKLFCVHAQKDTMYFWKTKNCIRGVWVI